MRIRHLDGVEDARALIRINAEAWREAYAEILPDEALARMDPEPTDEHVREAFDRLRDDRERILVAEDDTETVRGFCYFRWGDDTKSFVDEGETGLKEIYVEPEYWRSGIGTELLEQGLALLPEPIERVRLEMLDGNEVGRRFYRSHGFERTGSSEFEIGGEPYPTSIYTLEL